MGILTQLYQETDRFKKKKLGRDIDGLNDQINNPDQICTNT